jgi:hypothetical protein
MSIEAMKQALDALEEHGTHYARHEDDYIKAITALRQAIEQAEKTPLPPPECQTEEEKRAFAFGWWKAMEKKKQWVGLTDEERLYLVVNSKITEPNDEPIKFGAPSRKCIRDLVLLIEAKLKEKNT